MYNHLANIYDALVGDPQATKAWVDFIITHADAPRYLELACGSGEITIALAKLGKQIDASDLSEEMLERAKRKVDNEDITFTKMDLRDLTTTQKYPAILCLCDSLNYVTDNEDIKTFFAKAYEILEPQGTFIFDVHSIDRLTEFEDEFLEEGHLLNFDYEWSIETHGDSIYQNFLFFDQEGKMTHEQHVQRVYSASLLEDWLKSVGFSVSIYTDFTKDGVHEGEKYFFVCKKG